MLWLLPMLAGALASYEGQQQGASAYQNTFGDALRASLARRQQALALVEQQVKNQQPSAMQAQMAQSQQPAQAEAAQGNRIAGAFAARSGDGSSAGYQGAISGKAATAANAAGVAGSRAAVGQSFADALRQRAQGMRQMEMQEGFLGTDQQRADEMLPYQLEQAGQSGAGWRMAGSLLSGLGMAAAARPKPAPAAPNAGAAVPSAGGSGMSWDALTSGRNAGSTDLPTGATIDPYTGQLVMQA